MTTVDLTIVNVSLPTIGRELHFSATSLQWVATAYAVSYGGFLLLGGRIADLFGRRRVLISAVGLFSAGSLGCALASSDVVQICSRGVRGLAAAVMLPSAMSIVTGMFDEGPERNKALGIWGALGASGGTVGLLAGGLITRYLALGIATASSVAVSHTTALLRSGTAAPSALAGGYQHAMWVLGVIAVLALPVTFALLRASRPARRVTDPAACEAVAATS